MADNPPKEKGKGKPKGKGAVAFLTRKEFGLPVWAWALIVSVLLFLAYRYYKGKAGASSASNTAPPDSTPVGGTASGDDSGGTPSSDSSGTPGDTSGQPFGYPFGSYGGQGFTGALNHALEGTNPSATTPVAGVGALDWGGEAFTSRAQFNAYLKSKGLSVAQFAANHPAAYTHYLALPAGKTAIKPAKKTSAAGKAKSLATSATRKITTQVTRPKTNVALGTPKKASPTKNLAKQPAGVSALIQGLRPGEKATVTLLQPSATHKAVKASVAPPKGPKNPVKAPAKTAVKPAPPTREVAVKPAVPKPPAKRKK